MTDIVLPNAAASQGTAVEQARAVAEVAAAVRVAQDFPRNETTAREQMLATCSRTAVAERAFYEVPNRGAGLSVHAARELARIWGNVDYGVRELRRDDEAGVSEMQAWSWDQQTNVRSTRSFLVPHARMKGKARQTLTDLGDIYLNNQNTGARAVRECIFSVLPGWFLAEAEDRLKHTLRAGEGQSIEDRIATAISKFAEIDITQAQLEGRVGRPTANWQPKDLVTLTRIYSTISIDGISVAEFFPEQPLSLDALDALERTPGELAEEQNP
ncbi:hypothetical protein [Agromyces aureus]|uniref:Uncharacterized protein n=1 Tax=Agromyces aureus TaxID=453304 RepID=A0A191WF34_9MICO|nr:hypothetical protein [Agromyces aureus]ANJ26789.1 hypothetical protein ATC03_08750 [Agromyces aureus]